MLKKIQGSDAVCRLSKALYGLRQSARQWYAELDSVLRNVGLIPINADPCVYVDTGRLTFVLIYVDDILIFSNNRKRKRQIKEALIKSFNPLSPKCPEFSISFQPAHSQCYLC